MSATFGQALREAREAHGMEVSELAAVLDTTPTHVGNMEHGRGYPGTDVMFKLCSLFRWDPAVVWLGLEREKANDPRLRAQITHVWVLVAPALGRTDPLAPLRRRSVQDAPGAREGSGGVSTGPQDHDGQDG